MGELSINGSTDATGIGFGFGWVTGGNMWVMTWSEDGAEEKWTQNFDPKAVQGNPLFNSDWIDI